MPTTPIDQREAPRPSPVRAAVTSWWTWGAVAALLAGVVGVGAAGGWREAPQESLPQVPADARVALGPYDLVVNGWTVSDDLLADDLEYADAAAWVVISLEVTANPPSSVTWQDDSLEVSGLTLTGYPEMVRPADGSRVVALHPGVTSAALLLLPVSADDVERLADTEELTAVLAEHTYRGHVLSQEEGWWGAQPRVTLPIERDDAVATLEEPA